MTVLRVCYKPGVRFDEQYYVSQHVPLVRRVFGPHGLKHMEVLKAAPASDGSSPVYRLMFSAYFESGAHLQAAMQSAEMPEVLADVQKFCDGMPDIIVGETLALGS